MTLNVTIGLWLGYVLERRIFRSIDCRCKKRGFHLKKQIWPWNAMKVTIEFLVEIYFSNDLHFFDKYFTWGNIQPSRDFLDTLYIYIYILFLNKFTNIRIFFFIYRIYFGSCFLESFCLILIYKQIPCYINLMYSVLV